MKWAIVALALVVITGAVWWQVRPHPCEAWQQEFRSTVDEIVDLDSAADLKVSAASRAIEARIEEAALDRPPACRMPRTPLSWLLADLVCGHDPDPKCLPPPPSD